MNIYAKESLFDKLKDNTYPGRGIVLGVTPDGKHSAAAYFIMGRSANSRNRVFSPEPDGIRTEAHDPSKLEDPSLIIYHPVRQMGRGLIVTNGDQTDTIRDFLEKGLPMEQALRTREFEPDQPNCTPRISGIVYWGKKPRFALSILRTVGNDDRRQKKEFWTFEDFVAGEGRCIHTYLGDGNPLPSFDRDPYAVSLDNDLDTTAERYWSYLNPSNRVSLLAKFIDVETGEDSIRIINRFQ